MNILMYTVLINQIVYNKPLSFNVFKLMDVSSAEA